MATPKLYGHLLRGDVLDRQLTTDIGTIKMARHSLIKVVAERPLLTTAMTYYNRPAARHIWRPARTLVVFRYSTSNNIFPLVLV